MGFKEAGETGQPKSTQTRDRQRGLVKSLQFQALESGLKPRRVGSREIMRVAGGAAGEGLRNGDEEEKVKAQANFLEPLALCGGPSPCGHMQINRVGKGIRTRLTTGHSERSRYLRAGTQ